MRRTNPFPAFIIQAIIAVLLGVAATLLVRLAGTTAMTVVLAVLLVLFFFALLTIVRVVPVRHGYGPGGRFRRRDGGGPRNGGGGGSGGVREPRRPRWPGWPPREAEAEPEGAERTV